MTYVSVTKMGGTGSEYPIFGLRGSLFGISLFLFSNLVEWWKKNISRDEDPTFFSMDPDPAQLGKKSGSDLKSK